MGRAQRGVPQRLTGRRLTLKPPVAVGLTGLAVVSGVEAFRRRRAVPLTVSTASEERAILVWMVSLRVMRAGRAGRCRPRGRLGVGGGPLWGQVSAGSARSLSSTVANWCCQGQREGIRSVHCRLVRVSRAGI